MVDRARGTHLTPPREKTGSQVAPQSDDEAGRQRRKGPAESAAGLTGRAGTTNRTTTASGDLLGAVDFLGAASGQRSNGASQTLKMQPPTLPRIGARRKARRMNTPEILPQDVLDLAARRAVQARVIEAILELQLANARSTDLAAQPELREQVHATLDRLLDRVASMDVASC